MFALAAYRIEIRYNKEFMGSNRVIYKFVFESMCLYKEQVSEAVLGMWNVQGCR